MLLNKKWSIFLVVLLIVSLFPFSAFAADKAQDEKQSKDIEILEDENVSVKEQLEDEMQDAAGEYEETQGEKPAMMMATTSANSYQVAIANSDRSFTNVGSLIGDFGEAKEAMENNGSSDCVVLDIRRTIGNQVVAMKDGVVVTTADKENKSTLSFYMQGPEKIQTYVQNRIDAFYYDSTGSTVKMGISGQVVEGIDINEVELVPAVQAVQSYYTKNSDGELVHYVTCYSYYSNSNSNATKRNRYIGSYQSFTISNAPSFMNVGSKYYSVDGVNFYSDNKLTDKKGTFYTYYQFLSFRSKTSYTEEELNKYISSWNKSDSVLNGMGAAFINAQNQFGVNAAMLLAFAVHESGYGTSSIAKDKNNLFGVNATDTNPYGNAEVFKSVNDAISYQGEFMISRKYLDANEDFRYFGPNVGSKAGGLNVKYASDPYWGEKIAGHIYRLDKYLGSKDDNKYQLAVSNKITYAKTQPSTSAGNYYKYAPKEYNMPVGIPILIVSNSNGWYKIQSDMGIDCEGTTPASFDIKYDYSNSKGFVQTADYKTINNPTTKYIDPAEEGYFIVPQGVTRLGGATKWDTPTLISSFGWDTTDSVILASGNRFEDALSGAPLSGVLKAPILLTDKNSIPTSTMDYLQKYKPKTVYILGGTMVVGDSVINTLKKKGYTVKRIWGNTKYTTAIGIGNEMRKYQKTTTAFLVYGDNYPDALSVSSIASQNNNPIVFTGTKSLQGDTLKALKNWGIKKVIVSGGSLVISDNVINTLKKEGFEIERVYGKDLWTTNILTAKRFYPYTCGVVIATGSDFADALTGGPFAAKAAQPILLVKKDYVSQDVLDYIKNNNVSRVTILGGPKAVSENVKNKIYSVMAK